MSVPEPSSTSPLDQAALAAVASLALPLFAGLLLAWSAEQTLVGALLLLGEPLLLVGAVYGVLALAAARRWVCALALLLGCAGGFAALHVPARPTAPPSTRPEWTRQLRACAAFPEPVQRPVRLVQWSLAEGTRLDRETAARLGERADLVVLHGAASPEAGAVLDGLLDGEARYYPPSDAGEGGMTIVVRGSFHPCGEGDDAWSLDLPAVDGHESRAVVTFPRVEGAGAFPLVVARLDPPHGPAQWSGWPDRLAEGSQRLASVVHAIDASRAVLVADLSAPPSFRALSGRLLGAGLHELRVPPSWPSRVGSLPSLPLHRLDRVWVGTEWTGVAAQRLPADGQPRAPTAVTLVPEIAQAR